MGARKGNQAGFLTAVETYFQPQQSAQQLNKGHGRLETRTVSLTHRLEQIPAFPGVPTLIRGESECQVHRATMIAVPTETRYYVASFSDTAEVFADRLRGYWGVDHKAHSVRDVTQGEEASRTRTPPWVPSWVIARPCALNW